MWFRAPPDPMETMLNAPLPARQANRLFMVLLERMTGLQLNVTKRFDIMAQDMTGLHNALANLKAGYDALLARQEAAHATQLSDGQAAIDAATTEVQALADTLRADTAPQPSVTIPAVVPFAPNIPGDAQTLLRAAMPGGAA